MAKRTPSTNGANGGRDRRGRFAAGNAGGPGNPHARRVAELRAGLLAALTADDVAAVVAGLLSKAKGGDVAAARELLSRVFGPPIAPDILERIDRLEQRFAEQAT